MRFGGLEFLVVLIIILLFFGPKQIPKLTKTLKDSIKSFKDGAKEDEITATENEETDAREKA